MALTKRNSFVPYALRDIARQQRGTPVNVFARTRHYRELERMFGKEKPYGETWLPGAGSQSPAEATTTSTGASC